jgi:hypothetical protein
MKKLFIIFAISFLFSCVNQSTSELLDSGKIYIGMDKQKFSYAINRTEFSEDPFKANCYRYYFSNLKKEVLSSKSRGKYYVFESVSKPSSSECFSWNEKGDGVLAKILDTIPEVEKYVGEKIIVKEVVKIPEVKKEVKAEVKKENKDVEKKLVKKKKGTGTTNWQIIESKNEFYGTSKKYAVSNFVNSNTALRFPYQNMKARMLLDCSYVENGKPYLIDIEFNSEPNLQNDSSSYGETQYNLINVRVDDKITYFMGKNKTNDVNIKITTGDEPLLYAQKLTFEFKHYVGLGYYSFDMTDVPENGCK